MAGLCAERNWGQEEAWMRAALRASLDGASTPKDLECLRWLVLKASRAVPLRAQVQAGGEDTFSEFEEMCLAEQLRTADPADAEVIIRQATKKRKLAADSEPSPPHPGQAHAAVEVGDLEVYEEAVQVALSKKVESEADDLTSTASSDHNHSVEPAVDMPSSTLLALHHEKKRIDLGVTLAVQSLTWLTSLEKCKLSGPEEGECVRSVLNSLRQLICQMRSRQLTVQRFIKKLNTIGKHADEPTMEGDEACPGGASLSDK